MFIKLLAWIARIGSHPDDSDQVRLSKAVLTTGFVSAITVCILFVGPLYLVFGEIAAGLNYIGYGVVVMASLAWFARHKNHHIFAYSMAVLTPASNLISVLALGNFVNSGAAVLWGICYPLIGMLMFYGPKRTLPWALPVIANIALSVFGAPLLRQTISVPPLVAQIILFTNLLSIFGIAILALTYILEQRDAAFRLLRGEQEKAENLLLNILPPEIAAILKGEHRVIAEHFDGASILFADIVNFTPLSATMTPGELVELLNEVFSYFDDMVDRHGLEKIKTIGDCYMIAAGVPRVRKDHAHTLTQIALEMQDFVKQRSFQGKKIAFRIGINSGSVVAGVIGRKKFIYDLWGDAVNTASRMESHGVSGSVQITRATYELIKDAFECTPQGTVNIKGKGEMEVWHVMGARRAELSAAA
jgi:adenylate cyclase